MDAQALGAAIAILKKSVPDATPEDEGKALVVGSDGKWTTGYALDASISVSGTTLTITGGE